MAIQFAKLEGKAKKSSVVQFQYRDCDNIVRMVGDIIPRYVYWIKGENNKIYLWNVCRSTVILKPSTIKKKTG